MLSGFVQRRTRLCKDSYFFSHGNTQELGINCSTTMCSPFQHWQPEGLEHRRVQLHLHTSFSRKPSEITGGWKDEINWSCPECAVKVIKHRKEAGWQNTRTPERNGPPGPVCQTWKTRGSHCQTVFQPPPVGKWPKQGFTGDGSAPKRLKATDLRIFFPCDSFCLSQEGAGKGASFSSPARRRFEHSCVPQADSMPRLGNTWRCSQG